MKNQRWVTIPELAKAMGLSRITVYKRVKSGKIPAEMVGGNYIISADRVPYILGQKLSREDNLRIQLVVERAIKDFGEVFKWLSKE